MENETLDVLENAPVFEPNAEWVSEASTYYGQLIIDNAISFAPKLIFALFVLWVGTKIARRVSGLLNTQIQRSKRIDTTLATFISNLVRYLILAGTLLAVVSILGMDVAAIIGVFAAMTLAIGLALQGSMSNVAAGLLIIILRPYKIGQYVQIGDEEGHVEDINVFATTLRTLDNIKIIMSNGAVRGSTIKNLTSLGRRRVDVDFGIDYGDDVDKAIDIIKETAAQHPLILTDKEVPWAKVSCLNDSSVDIQMRVWCKPEDYWDVRFDLIKQVKKAFDKGGISIPYPHVVEIMKEG